MKKTTVNMKNSRIVVVGAGVIGLTLALALRKQGHRVQVVERQSIASHPAWDPLCDPRVYALTDATQVLLSELGVWEKLPPECVYAFQQMKVWCARGGSLEWDALRYHRACLGWIVHQQALIATLQTVLKQVSAQGLPITLHDGFEVTEIRQELQECHVELANGKTLLADWVVAADGAESTLRQQLGVICTQNPYPHAALTAVVRTQRPHEGTAWQCFHDQGPIALLPLQDPYHSVVVWSTDPTEIASMMALPQPALNEKIAQATEFRLGLLEVLHPPQHFSLYARHIKQYVKNRVIFIGDAAHTIHPLAGQGANLGFGDISLLLKTFSALDNNPQHLPSRYLRQFERSAKAKNAAMLAAMSANIGLFGAQPTAIAELRRWGLDFVNQHTGIKGLLANFVNRTWG